MMTNWSERRPRLQYREMKSPVSEGEVVLYFPDSITVSDYEYIEGLISLQMKVMKRIAERNDAARSQATDTPGDVESGDD